MSEEPENQLPSDPMDLARWLGRREAFGIVAGRCSAAEIECLCQINEHKLYLTQAKNWDEFCTKVVKASRRKIDKEMRLYKEFGPVYHVLTQLTRITADEFRTIKQHFADDGLRLESEAIALIPENSERLTDAVGKLLERERPQTRRDSPTLDAIVKRCEGISVMLEKAEYALDVEEKIALTAALARMNRLAARLGVVLIQM